MCLLQEANCLITPVSMLAFQQQEIMIRKMIILQTCSKLGGTRNAEKHLLNADG